MFEFSSIEQYHAQLQEGKITCLQAVEHYLSAIHAKRHLNAFVNIYADEALLRAKQLDAERTGGQQLQKLHGVVIGLKDVICYKDHPVSASSGILKDFISIYSATAVERLLNAGAIIIGHLNCDEFAMGSTNENSVYGRVLNPLDETRVPGGSSGGSAAALLAGLCMVSLGSDTGGSVRQPADFCGVIGFKPGYGMISRYGLIAYASSFDQIGIFGKNIPDIARLLEVMAGPDEMDSTASQKKVPAYTSLLTAANNKYRFAYFPEALQHPAIDPEIAAAIQQQLSILQHQGHEVVPVHFEWIDFIVPAYYVLTTAEASSNLSRYDGVKYGYRSAEPVTDLTRFYKKNRSTGFGKEVKRRIMLGTFVLSAGYYDAYYTRAQKVRRLLTEKINEIFSPSFPEENKEAGLTGTIDFIIFPNSPVTAFKAGEETKDSIKMYLADIYTVLANLTGIPAISIPLFKHSNGMPFGLQLMSNRFDELNLLNAANRILNGVPFQ